MNIKKIISAILSLLIILNIFNVKAKAVSLPMTTTQIEDLGECERHLQYWKESAGIWSYIVTTMVGYRIDGILHYAYCMQQDKKGVGGEQESYNVNITERLNNPQIWRAIINGFPYKSYKELGVANEQDAFVATKQAIYSVIYNWDVNSRYRGTDERGWQIVSAINDIVNKARNGKEQPNYSNNILKINKIGETKKDEKGNYIQEYEVTSSIEMSKYQIINIEKFPKGVYVSDLKNNAKSVYSSGEHFRLVIPSDKVIEDINGLINIKGFVKTYPIFYGKSYDEKYQDYALTYDAYEYVKTTVSYEFDIHKSSLRIIKKDGETNKLLSGVEFNIKYEDGQEIGNYKTDSNGEIKLTKLKSGKLVIKEISTQQEYIIDNNEKTVDILYNENKTIVIDNYHKKGNIKIKKVDKDDNKIVLKGVEFELIDNSGNVIKNIITDKNGEAEILDVNTGNYILREKKANKDYKITVDKDIIVEWGKTQQVVVENEKEKGRIKILKLSEDDNEITGESKGTPIKDVEFEIYNEERKLVDSVVTNEDGIAITKRLEKGHYKIKEVKSGKWYLLDDKEYTAKINKDEEIVEILITNKSEKPDVEVEKTGINVASPKQEIKYEFTIKNSGNTKLNDFVWYDYLPTEYVIPLKLETGTYNLDLKYSIYYKTNKNDYKIFMDNLESKINNLIDFSEIKLDAEEYITEFKIDFGNVDVGFASEENPKLYVYVKADIEKEDKIINQTKLEGKNKDFYVYDEDSTDTQINIKRFPKTGY